MKGKKMLGEWYIRAAGLGDPHRALAADCALQLLSIHANEGHVDTASLMLCWRTGVLTTEDFANALGMLAPLTHVDAAATLVGQTLLVGDQFGIEKRDEARGLAMLQQAAARGYAEAIAILGLASKRGWGVPVDLAKAIELLRRAAKANDAVATWELGMCHMEGEGVAKDPAKGETLLTKAAALEDAGGATIYPCTLAHMYAEGRHVAKNEAKAEAWWKRAAARGEEGAAGELKRLAAKRASRSTAP